VPEQNPPSSSKSDLIALSDFMGIQETVNSCYNGEISLGYSGEYSGVLAKNTSNAVIKNEAVGYGCVWYERRELETEMKTQSQE